MSLVKADMSDSISIQLGLPQSKSAQCIESLLEVSKKSLENGQEVLISGFGKCEVRHKGNRRGRDPHIGEEILSVLLRKHLVSLGPSVSISV